MPIIKTIPFDIIWHYSMLYYGLKWAYIHDSTKDVDLVGDGISIPKGLSDEDKFICIAFNYEDRNLGLTCEDLCDCFGWSKYHSRKIKKHISQITTVTLVCEEGGYCGRGWQINPDIIREIKSFGEKENEKCCLCANVHKQNDRNIFVCPTEIKILDLYRIQNGCCLYKKLETSDLYKNRWIKSY